MRAKRNLIIEGNMLNLELLNKLQEKPPVFTPGEALFWDDPHISTQMLAAHLDPDIDAASRRPEIIQRTVDWIVQSLGLHPDNSLLDLGCGPGLYAYRFSERGLCVTGVDYSRRSINYARTYALDHHLDITYRLQNYLDLDDEALYEAAVLIYGDYCPLASEQRARLLENVRRALKPGGHFILDVSTRAHRKRTGYHNTWYAVEGGFWKPGPHLVLEQGFDYPEQSVFLNQAVVIEADGKISIYRMWFQDYTPEAIRAELEEGGFTVESLWGDLTGKPWVEGGEWIGVVARKA